MAQHHYFNLNSYVQVERIFLISHEQSQFCEILKMSGKLKPNAKMKYYLWWRKTLD